MSKVKLSEMYKKLEEYLEANGDAYVEDIAPYYSGKDKHYVIEAANIQKNPERDGDKLDEITIQPEKADDNKK